MLLTVRPTAYTARANASASMQILRHSQIAINDRDLQRGPDSQDQEGRENVRPDRRRPPVSATYLDIPCSRTFKTPVILMM